MHIIDDLRAADVELPSIPFDVSHKPLVGLLITVTPDQVAASRELIAAHQAAVEGGWPRTMAEYQSKKQRLLHNLQPNGPKVIATENPGQSLSEALKCTKCPGPIGVQIDQLSSDIDFSDFNQLRSDKAPVVVLAIDRMTPNATVKRVLRDLAFIEVPTIQLVVRGVEGKQRRLNSGRYAYSSRSSWALHRRPEYPCAQLGVVVHQNASVVKAKLPHRPRLLRLPYRECLYCEYDDEGNEIPLEEVPKPDWADSVLVLDGSDCPLERGTSSRKLDVHKIKEILEHFNVPRCATHRLYRSENQFRRPLLIRGHNSLSYERVVQFLAASLAADIPHTFLYPDFRADPRPLESNAEFSARHCKRAFEISRE